MYLYIFGDNKLTTPGELITFLVRILTYKKVVQIENEATRQEKESEYGL